MPYVDARNFDDLFPRSVRDEFWRRVKFSLARHFEAKDALADAYRQSIENVTIEEQLLVYHRSPLGIAADLAKRDVTDEQLREYYKQFPDDLSVSPRLPART